MPAFALQTLHISAECTCNCCVTVLAPQTLHTTAEAALLISATTVLQAAVAGSRTVVGPGPSPPTITETDTGGQIVRAGHKRFFFDLGSNAKGKFLRITEVRLIKALRVKTEPVQFVHLAHAAAVVRICSSHCSI